MRTLTFSTGWVSSLCFSPDGQLLAAAGEGPSRFWEVTRDGAGAELPGLGEGRELRFLPDGRHVLGSRPGLPPTRSGPDPGVTPPSPLAVWGLDGTEVRSFEPRGEWPELAPDGSRLVWRARTHTPRGGTDHLTCVSTADGAVLWEVDEQFGAGIAFAPAANRAAVLWATNATLRDADTGEDKGRLKIRRPEYYPKLPALSPDARFLAVASMHEVSVTDLRTRGEVSWLQLPTSVEAILFTPDGRQLVAAAGRMVHSFAVEGWRKLPGFKPGVGVLHSLALSPDGMLAAAGGDEGRVALWDRA